MPALRSHEKLDDSDIEMSVMDNADHPALVSTARSNNAHGHNVVYDGVIPSLGSLVPLQADFVPCPEVDGSQNPAKETDPSSQIQLAIPIECNDSECRGGTEVTGELTFLNSSYDDSTTTCASSPVSEKLQGNASGITMREIDSEKMDWILPPSSSPLQCSSQVGTMSSPIRHAIAKEGERDVIEPVHCSVARCDVHVDDMNIARSGKRKRSESLSALDQNDGPRLSDKFGNTIPNPKRLTVRSQHLQHEKLKTPFRSPLLKRSECRKGTELKLSRAAADGMLQRDLADEQSANEITFQPDDGSKMHRIKNAGTKYRTARAATQFKSPLLSDVTTKVGNMVRMTPDIQTLERKSQILKRAFKIKHEDQERDLENLVQKWIDAGREVAWELWGLVKDNDTSEYGTSNSDQGWRWNEERGSERCHTSSVELDHTSDGVMPSQEDQDEPAQNDLGVMLRQLGIDPETLGWDEKEGTFVDK
ncbi:hypothetical protein APHAL10511_002135 [Amanita phalloides]|nr:hypothetical protein APHAL10511_002135 [Amanita phalloides]